MRNHYKVAGQMLAEAEKVLSALPLRDEDEKTSVPPLDRDQPTAVFLVGKDRGVGMHALLWVLRMFPDHFKNCVFLSVGEVDAHSFYAENALRSLRLHIENAMHYYVRFCHQHGLAADARIVYGADPVDELEKLAKEVMHEYPNSVCFASKLIFESANWLTPLLHNQTAIAMHSRLHLQGLQMVIVPMKIAALKH